MPLFLLIFLLLTSCSEIKTNDPKETYKYWAGTNPPDNLEIIKGKYWESAHWTREYIMYLKLKPTKKWWNEFIAQNHLQIDTMDWAKTFDSPIWFNPSKNSIRYKNYEFDQGSRYFQDTLTKEYYIYEIQL